jgi:DNA-binding response OmpR family regulator
MINLEEMVQYTKDLRILVVEDHDDLREVLSSSLKEVFKEVESVENGAEAIIAYREKYLENGYGFDIVLSDIKMPFLNGVDLTKKIYDINSNQVVIIMSAHDESEYLLPLINLGIEYFVKKPINYDEFFNTLVNSSKKIVAQKKSIEVNSSETILKENYIFNRDERTLFHNAENIYLTKYEIIFLQILSEKVDKIFSNEEIVHYFESLHEHIDMQNIRKLVSKLRKKLPEDTIESVYGIGYKLHGR